jgi:hypothetical protein
VCRLNAHQKQQCACLSSWAVQDKVDVLLLQSKKGFARTVSLTRSVCMVTRFLCGHHMNCQLRGGQSDRSVTGDSGTYLRSDSVPCTHSPGAGTLAISARCLLRRRAAKMQEVFPPALTDPPALGHWPPPAHFFIHSFTGGSRRGAWRRIWRICRCK